MVNMYTLLTIISSILMPFYQYISVRILNYDVTFSQLFIAMIANHIISIICLIPAVALMPISDLGLIQFIIRIIANILSLKLMGQIKFKAAIVISIVSAILLLISFPVLLPIIMIIVFPFI